MKWFPKAEELEAAKKRIEQLSVECANLRELGKKVHQAEAHSNALRTELEITKSKLREQTSADLMLVSARIIMDTLKGNKPNPQDIALQQNLYAQQQALGMAQSLAGGYGSGTQSLFGAIFGH